MPRKGFCTACGREVWLGRDGGCQFGHPASQMTNVHDASAPAGAAPALRPSPPAPAMPPPAAPPPATPSYGAAAVAVAPQPQVTPYALPDSAQAWGNSPDDAPGATGGYGFDYMSLPSDYSIGDTECLGRRVAARIFDNILTGMVSAAFMVPMVLASMVALQARETPSFGVGPYAISFAISMAYFIGLPAIWGGRTLGKAIVGITVTDLQGRPPSIGKLIVRELTMFIPDGLFNGLVGLFFAMKNDRTQRIGDVWAETVVVRTR